VCVCVCVCVRARARARVRACAPRACVFFLLPCTFLVTVQRMEQVLEDET